MTRRAGRLSVRPFTPGERVVAAVDAWRAEASDRKGGANDFMRTALAHFDQSDLIPFFCECADERCFKPVWLTRREYDERRLDDLRPVVSRDHVAAIAIRRAGPDA